MSYSFAVELAEDGSATVVDLSGDVPTGRYSVSGHNATGIGSDIASSIYVGFPDGTSAGAGFRLPTATPAPTPPPTAAPAATPEPYLPRQAPPATGTGLSDSTTTPQAAPDTAPAEGDRDLSTEPPSDGDADDTPAPAVVPAPAAETPAPADAATEGNRDLAAETDNPATTIGEPTDSTTETGGDPSVTSIA